jgi:tRNA U34 5-carboxymethylaminomethyl modifying GTPase MnmE/TrmE
MLNNISDAAILVPAIKDFIEVSVKNDEHLVKLAAVIQRAMSNKGEEASSFLTDEEKEALLKGIQEIQEEQEDNNIGIGSTENIVERDGIRDSFRGSSKS